ncbi:MAG: hypothetical protein HAW67_03715 [Endozoicomonadaceae bacterium]|nr:hypothetical protein [Endozoicomonadaceae bacterium]
MVRNPRSVVVSMLKLSNITFIENQLKLINRHHLLVAELKAELSIMKDKELPLYIRNAVLWKIKSSLFNRFIDLEIPSFLCKYEALISNKRDTCQLIAEQIDIPFDGLMLTHERVYQGIAQGKTDRTRAVDNQSIDKWKKTLQPNEEKQMQAAISMTMEKLGYV